MLWKTATRIKFVLKVDRIADTNTKMTSSRTSPLTTSDASLLAAGHSLKLPHTPYLPALKSRSPHSTYRSTPTHRSPWRSTCRERLPSRTSSRRRQASHLSSTSFLARFETASISAFGTSHQDCDNAFGGSCVRCRTAIKPRLAMQSNLRFVFLAISLVYITKLILSFL